MSKFKLNIREKAFSFDCPQVMGILNVTPDSFWEGSRMGHDADKIRERAVQILSEGGTMIDVGAYSTRPGAPEVSPSEELERLAFAFRIIREEVGEEVPVSVDTFRAYVAEKCVRELGADIINDISGGTLDPRMMQVVNETGAPYILMHMRGTPQTMQQFVDYPEGITPAVIHFFRQQLSLLNPGAQVILDPGFGFAKTLEQNYQLMQALPELLSAFPDYPMLVGISRKSMIYRLLDTDPAHALNGTTVLNTFALQCGAHILRVHDVLESVQTVWIMNQLIQ